MRVCFSYAAYAKNLIDHLESSNILVEKGLTDAEFSLIESVFHFSFPPDLRSILQEGLPVGHGFPNWRSSSKQQIEILVNLPVLELCKQVSINCFWLDSWGDRPNDSDQAVSLAKGLLKKAPVLVPIYRYFYIPTRPSVAGNPIFYVHGGEVKLWSFDIAGFFQQVDQFRRNDGILRRPTLSKLLNAPPWAAMEARQIEFWTELAEKSDRGAARDGTSGWWWNGDLRGCLEEVCSRLRNGGWKEEDVREMMMIDGCDELDHGNSNRHDGSNLVMIDKERLLWHVRLLSNRLLRGGWSTEDVRDCLGILDDHDQNGIGDEDSLFDFHYTQPAGDHDKKNGSNQLIKISQKKSRIGFQIDGSFVSHNQLVMTRRMPIIN